MESLQNIAGIFFSFYHGRICYYIIIAIWSILVSIFVNKYFVSSLSSSILDTFVVIVDHISMPTIPSKFLDTIVVPIYFLPSLDLIQFIVSRILSFFVIVVMQRMSIPWPAQLTLLSQVSFKHILSVEQHSSTRFRSSLLSSSSSSSSSQ